MSLFSRAFNGVPAVFNSPLDASAALANLAALKRGAPGKPLLAGKIGPDEIAVGFAPGSDYGRARSRFLGRLEPTDSGCVLRGRFIRSGPRRATGGLCIAACGLTGFVSLTAGLLDILGNGDSFAQLAPNLLFLTYPIGLGLLGCLGLWILAPSRSEMRDMKQHLAAALQASEPAPA